jgi:hypothetical protein
MLGAQGVVLGTRFYASEEAAGHLAAKKRIVSSSGDGTTRSVVFDVSRRNVWPAPFTGRCLNNSYTQRWKGRELELMRQGDEECIRFQEAQQRGDLILPLSLQVRPPALFTIFRRRAKSYGAWSTKPRRSYQGQGALLVQERLSNRFDIGPRPRGRSAEIREVSVL